MNAMTAEMTRMNELTRQNDIHVMPGRMENRGVLERIDPAKLPDEPTDAFSTVPYDFEESARYLWDDTQKLYYHACKANRFSENYLLYSAELEKSIREMGSYCLTKAALEQKGFVFSSLSELSVPELVGMVSYHLRKTHAAFEGIYRDNNRLGLSYLTREFRWVTLGDRLKATEAKIQKIKDGKLSADELLRQDESCRNVPRASENTGVEIPERLPVNPAALPIKGSMAREMLGFEKEEQKKAEKLRKEKERRMKQLEKLERELDHTPGVYKPDVIRLSKEQQTLVNQHSAENLRREIAAIDAEFEEGFRNQVSEGRSREPGSEYSNEKLPSAPKPKQLPPGTITEAEARKLLMDEAMKRGDRQAVMEIPLEDSDTFYQRFLRRNEEVRKRNQAARGVPSNETRKALREKRKKRK